MNNYPITEVLGSITLMIGLHIHGWDIASATLTSLGLMFFVLSLKEK